MLNTEVFTSVTGDFTGHKRELLYIAVDYSRTNKSALGVSGMRAVLTNYAKANSYTSAKWRAAQEYARALEALTLMSSDMLKNIIQTMQANFVKARLRADLENPDTKLAALGSNLEMYSALLQKTETQTRAVNGVDALLSFLDKPVVTDWRNVLYSGVFLFDTLIGRGLTKPVYGTFVSPTKGGKSFVLNNLAWGYWSMRRNVLHISLEDPEEIVNRRSASFLSRLVYPQPDQMSIPEYSERLAQIVAAVQRRKAIVGGGSTIHFSAAAGQKWSARKVRDEIQRVEKDLGVKFDVVLVDYLGEMSNNAGRTIPNRHEDLQLISSELRAVAMSENVLLWTACQSTLEDKALKKQVLAISDVAEAKGVIRTVDIAISIGVGMYAEDAEKHRHHSRTLAIMASKIIPAGNAMQVVGDLDLGTFFDNNLTQHYAMTALVNDREKSVATSKGKKKRGTTD
jgi:hypothetical protein